MKRFVQGPLTRLAMRHGHWLVRALGATWKVRFVGTESATAARRGRGPILYALPHGFLLPLAFAHRDRGIRILVSESRDGEIITRITESLGFSAVRGSSSRGGKRAVIGLVAAAREGWDLGITPDGPRGPRGSVAPGTVVVAARGDLAIVPVVVGCASAWRARSWDRFLVPRPFATVWVVYGEGILAPAAAAEEPAATSERVRNALAETERRAEAIAAGRESVEAVTAVPG